MIYKEDNKMKNSEREQYIDFCIKMAKVSDTHDKRMVWLLLAIRNLGIRR